MAILKDLKETEIGIIPIDWDTVILGTICDIYRGGSPRPIQNYLTSSSNGINWIKIGDTKVGGKYIDSTVEKIKPEGVESSRKVYAGDLILSNSMSYGRPYILNIDGCIHDGWLVIQNYQNTFNQQYLYYMLSSDFVKVQYINMAAGSSVQNLNKDKVHDIIVCVPTLEEQSAIAKALSDMDELISSLEKLVLKKQAIKQGVMDELLAGKKRLEGFSGEWKYKKFSDTFIILPNNTYSRDNMNNATGKIKNVHYGDVLTKYNSILDCKKEKIPFLNEGADIRNKNSYAMDGDFIIADTAEDGTVGKAVELINTNGTIVVAGLHTILCRPKVSEFSSKWLGYFLNSPVYHNQLLQYITGIKVSSISKSSIADTVISIPSKEEQAAITSILSDMDTEINKLEVKIEKYRAIKKGMMNELLSGNIRL